MVTEDKEPSDAGRGASWSTLTGILTGIAAVLGSTAALVAIFSGGADGKEEAGRPATVAVPDVVDELRLDARRIIRDRELVVSTVTEACSTQPRGTVLRQQPRAGAEVDR